MPRVSALLLLLLSSALARGAPCQAPGECVAPAQANDHVLLQHHVDATHLKVRTHAAATEPGEVPPPHAKSPDEEVERAGGMISNSAISNAIGLNQQERDAWKWNQRAHGRKMGAEWRQSGGDNNQPRWLDSRPGDRRHRHGSLRECQGHCQSDADCATGLTCYQRKGTIIVPGCLGDGMENWSYCHKNPPPPPSPMALPPPPAGAARMRLVAFNAYYLHLDYPVREDGIATALASMHGDVYVITEEWTEKMDILRRLREKSGRNYTVCDNGPQETTWDGDIIYDAGAWKLIDDGVHNWGDERGLSWAHLEHRETGKRVLIYGAHPLCCGNEDKHLKNAVEFVSDIMDHHPEYPASPVVIMGDFNALEDWPSVRLYENGHVNAYGKDWDLSMSFQDTFRATHDRSVSADTHNSHARLDYIFTERREPPVITTTASYIWRGAPGGSDHFPILADVVLTR